ncbi:MAG: hypothetical protein J6386_21840 [Candidatus Synoicihabitans palmerolidicus]|nr:hypothetical protein [Candidatus Synoicihabitans palmerolidicus]
MPGIEVPVGEIKHQLARMWENTAKSGGAAPAANSVRATQMNFVLHFGFATACQDAVTQFETVKEFAHRYPCRVVVLCPLKDDGGADEIRATVYRECFLGKSKSDTRCVECVMLSYSMKSRLFLENQVSICLSTDLPLYYWAHLFSDSSRLADYQFMLKHAKRVMFDPGLVPEGGDVVSVAATGSDPRFGERTFTAGAAVSGPVSVGISAESTGERMAGDSYVSSCSLRSGGAGTVGLVEITVGRLWGSERFGGSRATVRSGGK